MQYPDANTRGVTISRKPKMWQRICSLFLFSLFVIGLSGQISVVAAKTTLPKAARASVPEPVLKVKSWLLMDFGSGQILSSGNPDKRIEPASLTKIMTSYVVFDKVKKGLFSLEDKVLISNKAWRTGGSRMFVKVNTKVSLGALLRGLIIQSGNDAAVAMAEYIAGTEQGFTALMNQEAARLGMKNTHFVNSTGLPDPNHYSTAYDLAILSAALIRDFPEHYAWYKEKEFTYNKITQKNRNLLLWRDPTVDGIKTGHTQSAGYCLIASSLQGQMRLIAVITGAKSNRHRASAAQALLRYGYSFYETRQLYAANSVVATARVYLGDQKQLQVGSLKPIAVTLPRRRFKDSKTLITLNPVLKAPISKGQQVGELKVQLRGQVVYTIPLVALTAVAEGSWWRRIIDHVLLWFT
ncbi:MAG TPA: D-alanyl-D-alanine carboxypeptidase [Gammaproteobacteria bacterium]|nr:D-alanyl-D-alanine carboxypeptidase [Gammaproteobacteria bacterium]